MARMVKCKACGKQISQVDAYKHIHTTSSGKTQNHYYCSLEEYETIERDKELYKLCQYETDVILNRPITNNVRNKELTELHESGYTWEQIYRCIKANAQHIKDMIALNHIENDYQQIRYMMQVIKNVIFDFVREDTKNDWCIQSTNEELDVYEEKEETENDIVRRLKGNKKENENNISSFLNGLK